MKTTIQIDHMPRRKDTRGSMILEAEVCVRFGDELMSPMFLPKRTAEELLRLFVHTFEDEPRNWSDPRLESTVGLGIGDGRDRNTRWRGKIVIPSTE